MRATDFPHLLTVDVIFRDIDGMGHVNNAVYITHFETARTRFIADVVGLQPPHDFPFILAEVTCTYLSPAHFGDKLVIGSAISHIGTKSLTMLHAVDAADGRPVVTGRSVLVMYDYAAGKSIAVPESLREQIRVFQGAWRPL